LGRRICKVCKSKLEKVPVKGSRHYYCQECNPQDSAQPPIIYRPSKIKYFCRRCESPLKVIEMEGLSIRICPKCSNQQSAPPAPLTEQNTAISKKSLNSISSPPLQSQTNIQVPPLPRPIKSAAIKITFADRIRRPHVLGEMMRSSSNLSSKSQAEFLTVLENIVGSLRPQLEHAQLIRKIDVDHKRLWNECKGKKIAFIDGGVANMGSLGAAPVAIRVGSYVVKPGHIGPDRERFDIEVQIVEDLYQSSQNNSGFYEDLIEDTDKLRDVARITLETSGALGISEREQPDFLFMHGPLINPVSMYSFIGFPNFSPAGLDLLLPDGERNRTGDDANFVRVHLRQLELLAESSSVVCGVVERSSLSGIFSRTLLEVLVRRGGMTSQDSAQMASYLRDYKISDGILLDCLLEPGEYLLPIPIDRNQYIPGRVPPRWIPDLQNYPRPMVSYLKPSNTSLPLRVEMFDYSEDMQRKIFDVLLHSCRLLPKYSFPAGLDIVDKHAKIPAWMSKPVNNHLMAQIMKKAIDSKNPILINEVRRLLCGTARDWLFRPTFNA
jgi:hypothetical protein